MSSSRTKNVSLNAIAGLSCQVINLVITFISQSIFISTLGVEYLGVNGLFTNLLTMLSFAELGIGNAIVFSMYRPLAENDTGKLCSLMQLYKKAYRIIAVVVLISGICLSPFLDFFVRIKPDIPENLIVLFLLFLSNTVFSYLLVYKKSIIIADQKNYIVLSTTEIVHVAQIIIQIAILLVTHNYILYLVIQIIGTLISNVFVSLLANRMYPFLKQKAETLSHNESKSILRNVLAMAAYKLGSVILNVIPNIFTSILVGVREVGLVSNYTLLTQACAGILGRICDAFTASVGNLIATEDEKKQYRVFIKIFIITIWLYGFATVGLITIINPFIEAWIGKEYLLDRATTIAIASGFFVQGVHSVCSTYRTTLGLFTKGKFAPIASALLNVCLALFLYNYFGLFGIFIASPVSRLAVIGIVDVNLIFKKTFKISPFRYHIAYLLFVVILSCLVCLFEIIFLLLPLVGWLGVFIRIIIVTVLYNCIMLIIFHKTTIFREIISSFSILFSKN